MKKATLSQFLLTRHESKVASPGLMLNEKMTTTQRATLFGLGQVTQRIEESAKLRYLNSSEVKQVLNECVHRYKDQVAEEQTADKP